MNLQSFYQWCELQGLSPKTIVGIKSAVGQLSRRVPDVFKATDSQILEFFSKGKAEGFAGKPWGASNYNNIRKYLRKFYAWCVDCGYLEVSPVARIPRSKVPRRLPRRLSDEEKIRILYHAQNFPHPSKFLKSRNYAIIATLLTTGLRISELLGLKIQDADLEKRSFRVVGKGNKERLVWFPKMLLPALGDYMQARMALAKQSIFFFVSYRSNKKLGYTNLRRMLLKIAKASGLHFTAHQFRHTCFSLMAEQGVDLETIKEQAGHVSVATTQIYTKVSDRHRKDRVDRVNFV